MTLFTKNFSLQKVLKIIELLLSITFLFGIVAWNIFSIDSFDEAIILSGSLLAFFYLIGNWWIHKPNKANKRIIVFTILYGFNLFCLIFALVYRSLDLTGSLQMLMLSTCISILTVFFDWISSINKEMVLNKWMGLKVALLGLTVLYLFLFDYIFPVS